jgi:hypothetical protein
MKKILILSILIVFLITLSGCTTYKLMPITNVPNGDKVEIMYVNGDAAAVCIKTNSAVGLIGYKSENDDLVFRLAVKNLSKNNLNIIPEQMQVFGMNKLAQTKPLYVYPAEEYYKKVKDQQSLGLFLQALGSAYSSKNAGYSTTNTTYSGNIVGQGTYGSIFGSSSSVTYNSAEAQKVRDENQKNLNNTANEYAQTLAQLDKMLLKRNTLFPDAVITGYVFVKYDSTVSDGFIVTVPIENESFNFGFITQKQSK